MGSFTTSSYKRAATVSSFEEKVVLPGSSNLKLATGEQQYLADGITRI